MSLERAGIVAILDDEVTPLLGVERLRPPVVEDQQPDARQLAQQLGIASVAAGEREGGEHPGDTLVEHGAVLPACLLAKRAGQPTLADAAGAGDQQVAMLGDPVAAGELEEQRPVEAAHGTVIDVLDAGGMAQLGGAGARLEATLSAPGRLMLEQQAQPFGMAERASLWVGGQVLEAFGHAVEAKLVQQVECRMMKQG